MPSKDPRAELNRRRGKQQQSIERQALLEKRLAGLNSERLEIEQAQVVIQNVAELTQNELKYQISEIVSLALASVFDDPYEFVASFEQRRNQVECDLFFKRDGELIDPLSASGGGAVDVAAFALRIALWSLRTNRTRPVILLDEPMRFISKGYRGRASEMLKMLSDKLGLQIIMVTHAEEYIENADKVHEVKIKKGISYVC